jgi:hypothetical protein
MKNLVFILAIILWANNINYAQKLNPKDVPLQIANDFKGRFPEATGVKWQKEGKFLQAFFVNDGNKMVAEYDNNTWVKTKWIIPGNIAPTKIKEYVGKYYQGYKIKEIFFVDTNYSERDYEVEISKNKKDITRLIFDISCNFIRLDEQK